MVPAPVQGLARCRYLEGKILGCDAAASQGRSCGLVVPPATTRVMLLNNHCVSLCEANQMPDTYW